MPAYVIVDVNITDAEAYEEYKKATPITLAAHGGKFIARGGSVEVLEGDRQPGRVVILEFESVEAAKKWWSSPEYEAPKALRQRASKASLIVVEGVG
jgi:uncharacterized protein (DUF1330 family)